MTIVIQQLVHRYGDVDALRGITVQAEKGCITAILGPNAAGKSTLLRCIIGALKPTSGQVLIDEKPAHRISAYHLAQKVAYVPQRSIVSSSFTVREVVELGRYALPAEPACVDAAIGCLKLQEIEDRPYPALSVGQQQRVTLARALAQIGVRRGVRRERGRDGENDTDDPFALTVSSATYLVLDEPMSAMDLRHVRDCSRLLRELAEAGVAILIAMHDLALAARIADECWLLNDGRLAASGKAGDVLEPEVLTSVFGVDFEWALRDDGRKVLSADC